MEYAAGALTLSLRHLPSFLHKLSHLPIQAKSVGLSGGTGVKTDLHSHRFVLAIKKQLALVGQIVWLFPGRTARIGAFRPEGGAGHFGGGI